MARSKQRDFVSVIDAVRIDPLLTRTTAFTTDSRTPSVVLMFDSRIAHDQTRELRVVPLASDGEPVALDVKRGLDSGAANTFDVTCRMGAGGDKLMSIATVTIDFTRPPFSTDTDEPSDAQRSAMAEAFLVRLRDRTLDACAAALWSQQADPVLIPVAGAPHTAQAIAANLPRSAAVPAQPSRYRWLTRSALGLAGIVVMSLVAAAFLPRRLPDELAGIDPAIRQQMEAAGVKGMANPAAVNVTEQTLHAMGLDPGRAANLGCLAKQ